MTTLRARVWKPDLSMMLTVPDYPWLTDAWALSSDGLTATQGVSTVARSHTDALGNAHKMLADLDRELMAEVHESRSSRYAARAQQIADEALAATVHCTCKPGTQCSVLETYQPTIPLIHLAATHGKATA